MKTIGLTVNVLTRKSYLKQNVDCSANGISSKNDTLILINESDKNFCKVFEGDETNTVRLVRRNIGGQEYVHCEPITERPPNTVGPMFGGNFIYTSDSRFPNKYPIAIHDRYEIQK
jgi:hypothetical protein